ncbi:TolC family protein, partial [Rubrivivax gelatinosus]|uniref:TolC family protein n=1 Tax=Rubrivivax gelatinosus TaxID=28068 RepID=UPI002174E0A8
MAERSREDWRQTLALLRLQREAGQSSALDLVQAEGELAAAEAELQARRRALDQAGNALRLLVGAT